ASSAYTVQLNGLTAGTQYDQLNAGGNVVLGGATLNVSVGFSPVAGNTFTIIQHTSGTTSGAFAGLAQGATFTANAVTFQISYTGGSGQDVVLTVTNVGFTWDGLGGDTNWMTGANWVGNVAPSVGSDLIFTGTNQTTNVNNFPASTAFHSITFNAGNFTLSG